MAGEGSSGAAPASPQLLLPQRDFGARLGRSAVYPPPTAPWQLPPQKIIITTIIIIKQLCSGGIHWDLLWALGAGGSEKVYYLSHPPPGAEAF